MIQYKSTLMTAEQSGKIQAALSSDGFILLKLAISSELAKVQADAMRFAFRDDSCDGEIHHNATSLIKRAQKLQHCLSVIEEFSASRYPYSDVSLTK